MIVANYDGTAVAATPDPSPEQPSNRLFGYVVLWNVPTSIRPEDGSRHIFQRNSIVWTPNVAAYWTHDASRPLASTDHGSLTVTADDYGMRVQMDVLQSVTAGRDALAYVKSRLVTGMSIGGAYDARTAFVTPATPGFRTFAAGQFVANHVAIVINPSIAETLIAPTAENLAKFQKEFVQRSTNQKLTNIRLAQTAGLFRGMK